MRENFFHNWRFSMLKHLLSLLFLFSTTFCLGNEELNVPDSTAKIRILTQEYECVQTYDGDKIYLRLDRIYPMPEGLYLHLRGNDFVLLPRLNSDNQGCYINSFEIFNRCRFCGEPYFLRCTNSECPRNKK